MSTVLFSTNSLNKASGLLLLLVCVSTGHAHFLDDEMREPMRPTTVFFSCSTPEKCTGKATHKVCREVLYTPGFLNSEKKPLSSQSKHSNPYACSFSTGNVEQAAAYPEVYPNIKITCSLQLCYTFIPICWGTVVCALMETIPMRDGHDKEGSKIKQ